MKPIIIINKRLVWPGAAAWAFWPFILIKEDRYKTKRLLNHELIHIRQQEELLVLPFYFLYCLHYLINLVLGKGHRRAYREIVFEREAKWNEGQDDYLDDRRFWEWTKYL